MGTQGPAPSGLAATLADTPTAGGAMATTFGRYRLVGKLGAGAMGEVYEAFDTELERKVALKVLRQRGSSEAAQRMLREARAMAKVEHPNVGVIYDLGTVDGADYIAMELAAGGTLQAWQARRGVGELLRAYAACGRGLAAAHAAGVVHRDFKPQNVLHDGRGRWFVADFGLAQASAAPPTASDVLTVWQPQASLTLTGSLVGTPAFMAPEQWTGGEVTPATDQFAFCVALWHALSGAWPFAGRDMATLRAAILEAAPTGGERIPRRVREVLRRGLAKQAAARWPSMEALLAALARARSTRPWWAAVGGGLLLVSLGLIAWQRAPACPTWDAARGQLEATLARVGRDGSKATALTQVRATVQAWDGARQQMCAFTASTRPAQVSCLTQSLARLNAVVEALQQAGPGTPQVDMDEWLPSVTACAQAVPPTMVAAWTSGMVQALAYALQAVMRPVPTARVAVAPAVGGEPCAAVLLALADMATSTPLRQARRARLLNETVAACPDAYLQAVAWTRVATVLAGGLAPHAQAQLDTRLQTLAWQVAHPYLRALIAEARGLGAPRSHVLNRDGWWYWGLREAAHEMDAQGDAVNELRALLDEWQPVARRLGANTPTRDYFARQAARLRWFLEGERAVNMSDTALDSPPPQPITIEGVVVDTHGQAQAGVEVVAGQTLEADAERLGLNRTATARTFTDAQGRFTLFPAPQFAVVWAQGANQRSVPLAYRKGSVRLEMRNMVEGDAWTDDDTHTLDRDFRMWLGPTRWATVYARRVSPGHVNAKGMTNGVWRTSDRNWTCPRPEPSLLGNVAASLRTLGKVPIMGARVQIRGATAAAPRMAMLFIMSELPSTPVPTLAALTPHADNTIARRRFAPLRSAVWLARRWWPKCHCRRGRRYVR